MNKKGLVLISIIFSLYLLFFLLSAQENETVITGDAVTGEITQSNVAVSITVATLSPIVNIILPENETYITDKNIKLNFTASNYQVIWYNLDNGTNTTITANTTFNTTEGSHTIYLFANNTDGNLTSKKISFSVNITKFRVIYQEYANSTKGSSTNFNSSSFEDLQNLSNIVLENTDYGKIKFNAAINVTNDSNVSDNQVDLDSYTNISSNRIEVDTTNLPNFNKSATLYLYDLTFSNPRILREGSICESYICTEQSYSGGTLIFNVTQFTVYSAEESPTPSAPPSGGGGGGGVSTKRDFDLNIEEIKVKLKQGGTTTKEIIINNTGNIRTSFKIESPKLEKFLKISETDFSLNAGESKTIELDFLAREDTVPNLYLGKIIAKADGIEKEILVIIEVVTKAPLFDIKAEIPRQYLYVLPGEELLASIQLFNLGDTGKVDVSIDYMIKNDEGKDILSEHETLAVETQVTFIKSFEIPKDIEYGRYIFYVRATYNEEVASSSVGFNVGRSPFLSLTEIMIIISIIILSIIIFLIKKRRKKKNNKLF